MKGGLVAAAAAVLASGANANVHHRHAHQMFKKSHVGTAEVCLPTCSTVWTTITGEPTLVPGPTYVPPPVTTEAPATTVVVVPLPTPEPHTCPTPGTYTFPATTITVSETTTVCGATSTYVPPGTHTVGGVTTIVETATTVTCPYATVSTSGTVTTSTILQTTYVCPTPGTYTVAPTTTTVTTDTTIVYVIPTTITPGTYTAPEQVVTVTETDYVYYCPYTSSGLPTTTEAPAPTYAPPPPPVATYSKPEPSHPEPSKPAYHPPTPGGGLTSNNDHYGITYTPYVPETGNCKSASEVDADISALKNANFDVIRVYGTDCDTLENVGNAAEKYGVDMIVGVFVKSSGCSPNTPDIKEQIDQLASWGKWNMVRLFVVGNEAIMNGYCSASDVAALITTVKAACSSYQGPYTISETLDVWQRPDVASTLCGAVDVTGANIHAFFNPNVTPDTAGEFVAGQLEILSGICPGNDVINLECGWPTGGVCNGSACPGESEQSTAIAAIRATSGHQTVFFSADNDAWKSDQTPCQCEKTWGCKSLFGI